MIDILIADDEELIRTGIKLMLERYKSDYFNIHLCSNGKEAKEILSDNNIDILITDIRMPIVDGIELINYIKSSKKQTAIIILSGYDDFNYAKEAIKCGAKEYLLKPVNKEKLYLCLEDIEKEMIEKHEYLKGYYSSQLNYIIKVETIPEGVINKLGNFIDIFNNYYVGIFGPQKNIGQLKGLSGLEESKFVNFIDLEGNMVAITKDESNFNYILENNEDLKLIVGISKLHNCIDTVRTAYLQAKDSINHRVLIESKIIRFSEIENRYKKTEVDVYKIESIVNMLGTNRSGNVKINLEDIFSEKYINYSNINYFAQVEMIFKDKISDVDISLYDYNSIREYINEFKRLILKIDEELFCKKSGNSSKLAIKKALEYINDNYYKEISLAVIANEVNLSYTYFSEMFKNYTGETYINYLKKIRIAKAKELLVVDTNNKVYEIASKVGYEDTKLFTRIFRKETGISPIEYRNKYHK